ncbi:RTA1 like protein-domain-containing protein [Xylariomycetidae sp. FL0641]|nr:RTA1 like protein-domain-containing protein [Xylariomycetidae sp. FL0641]
MESEPLIAFGPDATCTLELCPIEWSVLQYRPSLAANATFIALYTLLLAIHLGLGIHWKSWWFMGGMVAGTACNILGYGGRIMLYLNPFSFAGFMIQIVCVGSAPVFYSAAIYVTITKTVEHLGPSLSRIKPKLYYIIFIICDVGSLVLQAVGGALSTTTSGSSQSGVDLGLAGLSFQVFSMLCFCGLFIDYMIRYFRIRSCHTIDARLIIFLAFLSSAILLILARCAYRVAELSQGYTAGLIHNEPFFIGLEGVLVVLAVSCLCIGHPGFAFGSLRMGQEALASDQRIAEMSEESK